MKNHRKLHENRDRRSKLIPYILFPMVVGILSGVLIFLFKVASADVMRRSEQIYAFVRQNPAYVPLLIPGAAAIGAVSALILKYAKECRGGGIPTAVASIRGLIPLKWVQGITVLFGFFHAILQQDIHSFIIPVSLENDIACALVIKFVL